MTCTARTEPGGWDDSHDEGNDVDGTAARKDSADEGAPSPERLLGIYLDDHLAGATAGLSRFAATARALRGTPAGDVLTRLHGEVAEDLQELQAVIARLGLPRRSGLRVLAAVAERAGRLKPNGRLVRRSPLASVVDLEGLLLGVEGKGALWRALRALADTDPRLDAPHLDALAERARRQAAELEDLRRSAVLEALAPAGT
jgi:hypothetical protein